MCECVFAQVLNFPLTLQVKLFFCLVLSPSFFLALFVFFFFLFFFFTSTFICRCLCLPLLSPSRCVCVCTHLNFFYTSWFVCSLPMILHSVPSVCVLLSIVTQSWLTWFRSVYLLSLATNEPRLGVARLREFVNFDLCDLCVCV